MTERLRYALSDQERQKTLDKFTSAGDPTDLRAELGAARLLANEAMEKGNATLASAILATVGRLSQVYTDGQCRRQELLDRRVALRWAAEAVTILAGAVEGRFVGWEDALHNAADEIGAALDRLIQEPRLLEDKRDA